MSDVIHYQDFDELLSIIDKSNLRYNIRKIKKAYEFANLAHGDQRRVSGVPFILHPTSVACILAEMGMDTDSIVAALLHDTVEDTDVPRAGGRQLRRGGHEPCRRSDQDQ